MTRTADECVRLSIVGSWSNARPFVNVFEGFVSPSGGASRTQLLDLYAQTVLTAWIDNMLPRFTDNYTVERVDYVDLDSVEGPTGTAEVGAPASGTVVGSSSPPNIARLVTKVLGGTQRGERQGRAFMPPPAEANVTENGLIEAATIVGDNVALQSFLDDCTLQSVGIVLLAFLVVIQWPSISVPQPNKMVPDPDGVGSARGITDLLVQETVSTQRRRLRP